MAIYLQERRIKKSLAACLLALANLQAAFFVNYLRKDYIKYQLHYQTALNKCSSKFYCSIVKAQRLIKKNPKYSQLFDMINHLSEIVFSLNQLRLRVDDYTTFKICARELEGVEKFSILIMNQLSQLLFANDEVELPEFEEAIHSFENIYNRTLQIVSVDPLVFMFFIQDAYALHEEFKKLNEVILQLKAVSRKRAHA